MRHVKEKRELKIVPRLLNWADESLEWPSAGMKETGVGKV